jgi:hypothetical protein
MGNKVIQVECGKGKFNKTLILERERKPVTDECKHV